MSVTEIEAAITELASGDLAELMSWLEDYHAKVWDKQIADDLDSGRLDTLLADVDREYEAGLAEPSFESRLKSPFLS
jgi:hypothetical protein